MYTTKILKNVKLHHFHFNSRAMVARAAMIYKNQPFIDHRIKGEDWATLKYSGEYEFRVLPLLEANGKKYSQMNAINTFLGYNLDFQILTISS